MVYDGILTSEVDADSPQNEDLWTKVKGNFEYTIARIQNTPTDANWVRRNHLKTDGETVAISRAAGEGAGTTSHVCVFSNTDGYGFRARIKVNNSDNMGLLSVRDIYKATPCAAYESYAARIYMSLTTSSGVDRTMYALVHYIQGSQDRPTVWMLRRISDGFVTASHYDPETKNPQEHYLVEQMRELTAETKEEWEVVCVELNRCPELVKHMRKHEERFDMLEQTHMAIYYGIIGLGEKTKPVNDRKKSPRLYHPEIKALDFDLDVEKLKQSFRREK